MEPGDIPADMADAVAEAREQLLEAVSDLDDDIANAYLEGEDISVETIKAALRKGTIGCQVVPVFVGSALKNKGVPPLLTGCVTISRRLWTFRR